MTNHRRPEVIAIRVRSQDGEAVSDMIWPCWAATCRIPNFRPAPECPDFGFTLLRLLGGLAAIATSPNGIAMIPQSSPS